jgi:hypothetical protein
MEQRRNFRRRPVAPAQIMRRHYRRIDPRRVGELQERECQQAPARGIYQYLFHS